MKYIDTHIETLQQENLRTNKKILIPFLRDSILLIRSRIKHEENRKFPLKKHSGQIANKKLEKRIRLLHTTKKHVVRVPLMV